MCMLSFYPPGAPVDAEHLLAGARKNKDGYGYAIVSGTGPEHILVGKSMKAWELVPEFIEALTYARAENPNTVALFHSRWGTGGTQNEFNCHPFFMGDGEGGIDEMTVVGHNGVFFSPDKHSKDEKRCDTRIFAEEILPEIPMFDYPDVLPFWEQEIGQGNKVIILTANPAYRHRAYMINPRSGQWVADGQTCHTKVPDDAVWHSNADWRYAIREAYKGVGASADSGNGPGRWDWQKKKWVKGYWVAGVFRELAEGEEPPQLPNPPRGGSAAPAPRRKARKTKATKGTEGRAGAPAHERGVQTVGEDGWTDYTSTTGRHYRFRHHDGQPRVNPDGTPAECPTCFADGELIDAEAMLCLQCASCLGCGNWPDECKCHVKADAAEALAETAAEVSSGAVELYTGGATKHGQDPDSKCIGSNWDPVTGLCDAADCDECAAIYAENNGGAYVTGSSATLM